MSPSPLVDVAFKVFNNREQGQRKRMQDRMQLFWPQRWIPGKPATRSKPTWGGNNVFTVRRKGIEEGVP